MNASFCLRQASAFTTMNAAGSAAAHHGDVKNSAATTHQPPSATCTSLRVPSYAHAVPCEQARCRQHRQNVDEGQPHSHSVLHDRHLPSAASAAFSSRASSARASSTSAAARSPVTVLRRSRQL